MSGCSTPVTAHRGDTHLPEAARHASAHPAPTGSAIAVAVKRLSGRINPRPLMVVTVLALLPLMAAFTPAAAQGTAPMNDPHASSGGTMTEGTASGSAISPGATSGNPGMSGLSSGSSAGSTQIPPGGRTGTFSGGGLMTNGTGGSDMAGSTMGGIEGASKGAVGGPGTVSGGTGDGFPIR